MGLTSAQRYNKRMDEIFDFARKSGALKTQGCTINKKTAKVIGQALRTTLFLNDSQIKEFSRTMEDSCKVKRSDF